MKTRVSNHRITKYLSKFNRSNFVANMIRPKYSYILLRYFLYSAIHIRLLYTHRDNQCGTRRGRVNVLYNCEQLCLTAAHGKGRPSALLLIGPHTHTVIDTIHNTLGVQLGSLKALETRHADAIQSVCADDNCLIDVWASFVVLCQKKCVCGYLLDMLDHGCKCIAEIRPTCSQLLR